VFHSTILTAVRHLIVTDAGAMGAMAVDVDEYFSCANARMIKIDIINNKTKLAFVIIF